MKKKGKPAGPKKAAKEIKKEAMPETQWDGGDAIVSAVPEPLEVVVKEKAATKPPAEDILKGYLEGKIAPESVSQRIKNGPLVGRSSNEVYIPLSIVKKLM